MNNLRIASWHPNCHPQSIAIVDSDEYLWRNDRVTGDDPAWLMGPSMAMFDEQSAHCFTISDLSSTLHSHCSFGRVSLVGFPDDRWHFWGIYGTFLCWRCANWAICTLRYDALHSINICGSYRCFPRCDADQQLTMNHLLLAWSVNNLRIASWHLTRHQHMIHHASKILVKRYPTH